MNLQHALSFNNFLTGFVNFNMLQLTFLGTSSGVPTKFRNVSGIAVECYLSADSEQNSGKKNKPWILCDCGEGTQQQILQTKLSLLQLRAICITHAHGDHCYGLPGLLSSMAMAGRKDKLTLIAPRSIAKLLDTLTITTQLYFLYEIEFIAIESLLEILSDTNESNRSVNISFSDTHIISIDVTALSHRIESYAFSIQQIATIKKLDTVRLQSESVPAGVLWGQLFKGLDITLEDGRQLSADDYVQQKQEKIQIVISGDNDNPNLLQKQVQSTQLLVHEATYTQKVADKINSRKQDFNPQHTTAKQLALFAAENNINNLVLTHFSARYQPFDDPASKVDNMGHIREEVAAHFNNNFWLANDFDVFQVTADKVVKIS